MKVKKQWLYGVAVCMAAMVGFAGWKYLSSPKAVCRVEDFSPWAAIETAVHPIGQEKPEEKRVFLTFDDGPSSTTEEILKILQQEQVPASFFVIAAENNQEYLPLLSQMEKEGHTIALHTCTHEYSKIYSSTVAYWEDIEALKEKISPYITSQPQWLRFPGGSTNTVSRKYGGSGLMEKLMNQAEEKGYKALDWNVSAEDAVGGTKSPESIVQRVIKDSKGHNTCVVLMHDSKETKTTAKALPDIIAWYKQEGYRFCSLQQENP